MKVRLILILGSDLRTLTIHIKLVIITTRQNKLWQQIDQLSIKVAVPEAGSLEIVNLRASAAIKARNLDDFQKYLIMGADGAKVLQSEKRRQEVIANWKSARKVWPHETQVLGAC